MGYEYFEVTAEVGIRAWGRTMEESFAEAARALFELMADTSLVRPQRAVSVQVSADVPEILLADWLNRLILERDRTGLVFSDFDIAIAPQTKGFGLMGKASGEPLDRKHHDSRIDVKAVTYHGLNVRLSTDRGVEVECVLDI